MSWEPYAAEEEAPQQAVPPSQVHTRLSTRVEVFETADPPKPSSSSPLPPLPSPLHGRWEPFAAEEEPCAAPCGGGGDDSNAVLDTSTHASRGDAIAARFGACGFSAVPAADFSDRIRGHGAFRRLRRRAPALVYAAAGAGGSAASQCTVCGAPVVAPPPRAETLLERYNRLQVEAAQLEADLRRRMRPVAQGEESEGSDEDGEDEERPAAPLAEIAQSVRALADRVRTLPATVGVQALPAAKLPAAAEEAPQQQQQPFLHMLADVDRRLGALERTVGPTDAAAVGDTTLVEATAEWRKRLRVLTAAQLDSLTARVQDATRAMEALGSAAQLSVEDMAQIHALHEGSHRLEAAVRALPDVVERLRSLAPLHEASASFVDELARVEADQRDIHLALAQVEQLVTAAESSTAASREAVLADIALLESRLPQPPAV